MQPHTPYMGQTADQLRERIELRGWHKYIAHHDGRLNLDGVTIWDAIREGSVSLNEARQAYRETLQRVFNNVRRLVDELPGKTVVTADHGEMLGERVIPLTPRRYGHPHDIQTRESRIVPWFVIEGNRRRKIIPEDPIGAEHLDEETAKQRLHALGYIRDLNQGNA